MTDLNETVTPATFIEKMQGVAPDVIASALQAFLDESIDRVLDVLDVAAARGVEIDPLQTILARVRVRGGDLDFSQLPPVMQMLLGGLDG